MNNISYDYSGSLVTRTRDGWVDSFTLSGFRCFEDLVREFASRVRYGATLLAFNGNGLTRYRTTGITKVDALSYEAAELAEMVAEYNRLPDSGATRFICDNTPIV